MAKTETDVEALRRYWTPQRIAALRTHLGMSGAKFAARMGLSRAPTVYEWESGRSEPTGTALRLLECIADAEGFTEGVARKIERGGNG